MKILLVRTDGIGDALACAPLVAALRSAGHEPSIVLGAANRDVFASNAFAHVHVLERIPWPRHGTTPETWRTALSDARAERYDVAIVASEEMDAYRFARDAGIETRVGFVNGWAKPFKTIRAGRTLTHAVVRTANAANVREHEVETIYRLGAGFADEAQPTRDASRLRELVLDDAPARQRYVAIQASPKYAADGLDVAAFVALVRTLRARGRSVRILGDDRAFVRAIARACGVEAFVTLSVAAWKAHLAAARAVVTPDSGAAHVAGMVGVPCVDCFPPRSSTAADVKRWRPWAARHRTIVLDPARERTAIAGVLANAVDDVVGAGRS